MLSRLPQPLYRAAYQAQQRSMLYSGLVAHEVLRWMARRQVEPGEQAVEEFRRRYAELLERDLTNVADGLYPAELLFRFPLLEYARRAPTLARDLPRVLGRMRRRDFRDLPEDVDLSQYPEYFRRTFHWQSDGYFSVKSAERYDIGVELLFLGTADVMRRQIIPPITRHLRGRAGPQRLVDVACGTGRTLLQLAAAHPDLHYYGIDLSPYYIRFARRKLEGAIEQLSLSAENAEEMPYRAGYFDVVVSVHLFHELPRGARRNVVAEMYRVLRPGGLVVLEDSAQRAESPELGFFLRSFSEDFHEPYHRDYVEDDLAELLRGAGFEVTAVERHFVSKVVAARKPVS